MRSLTAQEQFLRGAKRLTKLKHPKLPRVKEHFIGATGEQCVWMDYV